MAGIVGALRALRLGTSLTGVTTGSTKVSRAFAPHLLSVVLAAPMVVASASVPMVAQAQSYAISQIEIQGNQRVERGTILSYAAIPRGATLSAAEVNDAIGRIRASGLFESVEPVVQGNRLVISVVEYPTVSTIAFEGNRRVKNEDLAEMIASQSRRVFSPTTAQADAQAIAEAYAMRGNLAARVTPKAIRRSDNRIDLVFEIIEGGSVEVERIGFVGNKDFSDRRLRRVLATKEAGFLRAVISSDTFIEDRIPYDEQVLADFYASRGYPDFRVTGVSAELAEERDAVFLTFNVQEGQRFDIGAVDVVSLLPNVDAEIFSQEVRLREGKTYSPVLIDAEVTRLERLAVNEGYDFVEVVPRINRNDRALTLDVTFELRERRHVFVERIDIEGNTTTEDRVIRRQFDFVEGDPFNPRAVRVAADRIRALGFFEDVELEPREGSSPQQVILDVNVEEAPTGSISFGGSYSGDDGLGALISYSERNFLGRGQQLSLSANTSSTSREYSFSFSEPALLSRPDLRFSFEASYSETDGRGADYDTLNALLQPSISFPVNELSRLTLRGGLHASDIVIPDGSDNDVGDVITAEAAEDRRDSLFVGLSYDWDTDRSGLDPINRYKLTLGADLGGLTEDHQYVRATAKAIAQTKVLSEEVILRATFQAGMLNFLKGTADSSDRFVIGSSTMRGFSYGGIGPREVGNGVDDPLGGNYYAVLRLETEFPLGLPEEYGLSGGLFYDIGSVWGLSDATRDRVSTSGQSIVSDEFDARQVIGVSLNWRSAIGPLQLNWSEALDKSEYDDPQSFNLTIAAQF